MPRVECIIVGRELGTESEVYINEAPSVKSIKLLVQGLVEGCYLRLARMVRRNCNMKSKSSSRQPCSLSNKSILSAYAPEVS